MAAMLDMIFRRSILALVGAFVVMGVAPRAFAAESTRRAEVEAQVIVDHEPGRAAARRQLVAVTVSGGPRNVDLASWALAQVDVDPIRVVPAIERRSRTSDLDRLAVAFVVEGHFLFMGGDEETEPGHGPPPTGVLAQLPAVVERLRRIEGADTMGTLIVYGSGARVVTPMQAVTTLRGDAFGQAANYEAIATRDLVAGVAEALRQLESVVAARRALIVLGDGTDTDLDTGKRELDRLRRTAAERNIDLYAVNFSAEIGDEMSAIGSLVPDFVVVPTVDRIAPAVEQIVDRINNRYVLLFDISSFDRDNHEFELRLDGARFPDRDASLMLSLAPSTCGMRPAARSASPAVASVLFAVVFAVVLVLAVRRNRRRRRSIAAGCASTPRRSSRG